MNLIRSVLFLFPTHLVFIDVETKLEDIALNVGGGAGHIAINMGSALDSFYSDSSDDDDD